MIYIVDCDFNKWQSFILCNCLLKKYDYKDSIKVDENVISLYELKKEFN